MWPRGTHTYGVGAMISLGVMSQCVLLHGFDWGFFAAGRQEVIQMPEEGTTRQEEDGSKQRKKRCRLTLRCFNIRHRRESGDGVKWRRQSGGMEAHTASTSQEDGGGGGGGGAV